MKHTPTPWTLGAIRKRSQTACIDALHYDPDLMHQDWEGMIECCGFHDSPHKGIEKAEANARFIVRAVNHHERLVEALRAAMRFIDCHVADPDLSHEMIEAYSDLNRIDPHNLLAQLEAGEEGE